MNDLFSHYNSNAQRYVEHEYVPCAPKGETHIIAIVPCHRHGRCFSTAPTLIKITSTTEQMRLTFRGFRRRNPTLVRQRRKPRPKTTTKQQHPTTATKSIALVLFHSNLLYIDIYESYIPKSKTKLTREYPFFCFPNELIHIDDINEETIVCHTNNNNESSMDDSL